MKKQILALILFILVLSGCAGPAEEPSSSSVPIESSSLGASFDTIPLISDYSMIPGHLYETEEGEDEYLYTFMYADGQVVNVYTFEEYELIDIETTTGEICIMHNPDEAIFTEGWDTIKQFEDVRMYFMYIGSTKTDLLRPTGMYIGVNRPGDSSVPLEVKLAPKMVEDTSDSEESQPVQESQQPETTGQRNALEEANSYLRTMPFSYSGLVEQLEYEGYSNADATYAADHCGADWNEQALKEAESYLDVMAFSYSGLKEQLEYEGYTSDQATYGADNCGADWNEQAVKCAKSYLDSMSFSRDELISQLEYEGFTRAQAEYGAAKNGY
jgi:hypothetical protein